MKKRMKRLIVPVFFLFLGLFFSNNLLAQDKWGIAFRPGIDFSAEKIGGDKLNTGYGLEATISYRFQHYFSVFAGWSFNSFSPKQSLVGSYGEFDESGYSLGARFIYPIAAASKFNYVISGGITYNHIEVENYKRETIANSGYGFGWQLEAGFSYKIIKNLDIMPTVRYRSLATDITIENTMIPIHLNYVSVGAAAILSF